MPALIISTNVSLDGVDTSSILTEATSQVAKVIGKPESYVMIVLNGSTPISLGGTMEPAAYGELVSIGGLNPEVNKDLSATIAAILEKKLSVPKSRLFLKFFDSQISKEKKMEAEVVNVELVLPTHFSFKRIQVYEKYPKGQPRGRWKHLKQILQAENYQNYPLDEPNYVTIESPPSMHPPMRICDITGFEAPYHDPRTNLRYANTDVFKFLRSLPNEYVQRYLALRNAAVTLK